MSTLTLAGTINVLALEKTSDNYGFCHVLSDVNNLLPNGIQELISLAYSSMFSLASCVLVRSGQTNMAVTDWRDEFFQNATDLLHDYLDDFHIEARVGHDMYTLYTQAINAIIKTLAPLYPSYFDYIKRYDRTWWVVERTSVFWNGVVLTWIAEVKSTNGGANDQIPYFHHNRSS